MKHTLTRRTSRRPLVFLPAAMILIAGLVLLQAYPATEAVRLRNALVATLGTEADFDWTPAQMPADFLTDIGAAPDVAADFAASAGVAAARGDLDKMLAAARALLPDDRRKGGGIHSNFQTALHAIVEQERGYCADYMQVMLGLAHAAGVAVRKWGMSFDNYGGDGHTFIEFFDRGLGQWIFLDAFYGFYAVDGQSGKPLSVLQFRERALERPGEVKLVPVQARFVGQPDDAHALLYYRKGFPQLYLVWGTNIFAQESHPWVRAAARVSRSAERLAAIALGLYPEIRLYPDPASAEPIRALLRTRQLLLAALAAEAILAAAWIALLVVTMRRKMSGSGRAAT